jgi:hypothetical protein
MDDEGDEMMVNAVMMMMMMTDIRFAMMIDDDRV